MAARVKTRIVAADESGIAEAAALLRAGGIAAIPTETVYGLAAGVRGEGIGDIFAAKGRPQDNPLIVHVSGAEMAAEVASSIPAAAAELMHRFWPGPLSLILKKRPEIPASVSAGLDTVAIRMPAHPAALAIIEAAGEPLAAPSANTSGRPSPTSAAHVLADLDGRVPLIVDGGPCTIGVESTVLDLSGPVPVVLRPGDITPEQIAAVLPQVRLHDGLLPGGAAPPSPGMKYRHYAPAAQVLVFAGAPGEVAKEVRERYHYDRKMHRKPRILCSKQQAALYQGLDCRQLGSDAAGAERALFGELRLADSDGRDVVYFHYEDQMGIAVKNRILKAASPGRGGDQAQESRRGSPKGIPGGAGRE